MIGTPILSIAFLLVVSGCVTKAHALLSSSLSVTEEMGQIKGVILDPNDARVPSAIVTIESAKVKLKVKSGSEGNFEVELPAGLYRITIRADGFRKFEFSPFNVKPNVSELVNIHLEVDPPKMPLKVRLEPHKGVPNLRPAVNTLATGF